MRLRILAGIALALFTLASAGAQSRPPAEPPNPQGKPGREPAPALPETRPGESLSDRLDRQDGVLRPPSTGTPENVITPKDPGRIRVIPPPGSPQGDPEVQPK